MKRYGLSYEHLMPALARSAAFALVATAALLALALLPGSVFFGAPAAFAQADEDEVDTTNRERLAKEFSDPLTTLPQIFVQDAYTPANYGTDAQTNRVVLRAIIPRIPRFSLLPFVQLIRPSFFLVTVRPVRAAPRAPSLAICNCSMP